MRIGKFLVILAVLLLALPAQASKLTDGIQRRYEATLQFQADFQQELTQAETGIVDKRSGKIWFKQPGLVRFETLKPHKETLVAGAKFFWQYSALGGTAEKYPAEQAFKSKSMLRFLSGKANLKTDFIVEEQGVEGGLLKLRLVPREPDTLMALVYLWVEPKSFHVSRILIIDFWRNGNQVTLSNFNTDAQFDTKVFEFVPPAGVKVTDNTKK